MSSYSDFANAASDILLKKGDALARGKANSGEIWGSTIATLGQTIPKQVQDAMAAGAQKRKTAQIQSIIQQNGGDLEKSLPAIYGIDATLGGQVAEHVAKVNKDLAEYQDLQDKHQSAQLDLANKYLDGVHDETSYAQWAVLQNKLGRKVPPQYDPEFIKQERDSLTERQRALAESKLGFGSSPEGIYSKGTGAIAHPATPKRTFERVGPNQTLIETTPGLQTPYGGTQQIGTVEPLPTAPGEVPAPPAASVVSPNTGTRVIATGPPAAMTPAQQAADARAAAAQGETARHNRVTEARLGAAAAQANAPPVEIKPGTAEYQVAKDLAAGKLTMLDFQRLYGRAEKNSGTRQGIYNLARQLNPDFEPAQFELGFKMAGNPQMRQRIVAINAIDPVMTRMEELIDQSGNTDIPALNKLLNAAKFQLGNQTVTNFRQLQTLLGDEVGNALGVGSGSDLKTKLGIDLINPNLSPGNFRSTMEQARTALQQRRGELAKTMGPYAPDNSGSGPAVGTIKTFPNGNKGRWDGKGWELVK